MKNGSEILIIGAGIIGSAVAESCARRGLSVQVLEAGIPAAGTTAAGMGHLVVLDDNPAELALCRDGLQRWQACSHLLPSHAEYRACGTLWLARDDAEMAEAERKQTVYQQHGLASSLVGAAELRQLEPALTSGLAGALRVRGDAVLYPPVASAWLLAQAQSYGARLHRHSPVQSLGADGHVVLADGRRLQADRIVIAAGNGSAALLPGLPLKPRKGQLLITERYPATIRHQLVELGYVRSAHSGEADSVAFNVQPRATGQLLIGSSRQYHDTDPAIAWPLMQAMLARAFDYLPGLRDMQAIRAWSGFRPSTPDKLPLLGQVPGRPRLWLATGHEGLGITTALASGELLAQQLCGEVTTLDPRPYDPGRFAACHAPVETSMLEPSA
ncbi:NAD(P)/FAD-dependent oxidoreductase [Chitinimonas naiadis]